MKILIAALMLTGLSAQASSTDVPRQIPSAWELGMVSLACKVDLTRVAGAVGTVEKVDLGDGYKYLYTAYV
jgi:hypothetical protein